MDEISIFIGIAPCSGGSCDDVGQVLYNGAYDPQRDPNNIGKGLFEDFSVQLPAGYPTGDSVLTVFHIADTQVNTLYLYVSLLCVIYSVRYRLLVVPWSLSSTPPLFLSPYRLRLVYII